MVREANKEDLNEILCLYLHLHEDSIPDISNDEKTLIATCIEHTRDEIVRYFSNNFDIKNEQANKELQYQGKEWIKDRLRWMNSENVNRSASLGMYYSRHG